MCGTANSFLSAKRAESNRSVSERSLAFPSVDREWSLSLSLSLPKK